MMQAMHWHDSPFTLDPNGYEGEPLSMSLARVCAKHPKAIAILDEGIAYTFLDLTERIGGMVRQLCEANASNEPIALLQSSGIQAVVAWFACGLANKPFLLLDAQHPPERLKFLLQEAACSWVLCDDKTNDILASVPGINIIIDKPCKGEFNPHTGLAVNEPAMLFPTSGSSGEPKLIAYANITLQVKVQCSIQLMQVQAGQRVLIAGSHANYGFMHHALVFLLAGGTLCLFDIQQHGFNAIVGAITQYQIRHIRFTPSLFRKLAAWAGSHTALKQLDGVRFSGEPLLISDLTLASSLLHPSCLIQNVYGSTESALFIWTYSVDADLSGLDTVPIGQIYPYSSFAIRMVHDDTGEQQGELIIRSAYHALGDYRRGQFSHERFARDEQVQDERVYATGDWVELLPDGHLLHLGRLGRMVKIRGNRVYLNEVENALLSLSDVDAAAVLAHEVNHELMLYAFVSNKSNAINELSIRALLRERLPDYMVPSRIQCIEQIPLLVGGKVDYTSLCGIVEQSAQTPQWLEPDSDDMLTLVRLWNKYLWKGAHKEPGDFISLGGDSLGMMSLVVEAEQLLERKMDTVAFRTNSTFRQLAVAFGLSAGTLFDAMQLERIYFKPYRKNIGGDGIALAMPNVFGHAQFHLVHNVSLFPKHMIWGADYIIESGSLNDNERWWYATQQIVSGIQLKQIPVPEIVFGFSIGGSLAWMASRLLIDTSFCPKWVVLFDAPPLHRYAKTNRDTLPAAFFNAPKLAGPRIIQVRRKPLFTLFNRWVNCDEWLPEDGIEYFIDIATVDHDEMAHPEILKLVQARLVRMMHMESAPGVITISKDLPALPGVLLFKCIEGDLATLKHIKQQFPVPPDWFTLPFFVETILAIYQGYDRFEALDVLAYALNRFPSSKSLHYLRKRLLRNESCWKTSCIPSLVPKVFEDIEIQLNSNIKVKPNLLLRQRNFVYWVWDVCAAIWTAKTHKRKNVCSD